MLKNVLEKIDLFISHFRYAKLYFSQNGEDILLEEIFHNQQIGTYVDVGCHHPVRYSNTFLLYKKGWSGVCFDPDKRNADEFNSIRPRDVFINKAVGSKEGKQAMYFFDDGALNTFNKKQAQEWFMTQGIYKQTDLELKGFPKKTWVNVVRLNKITNGIDLLCIDTEGNDLEVLHSIDWTQQKPKVIVVEIPKNNSRIHSFLTEKKYSLIARTNTCGFYKLVP